MDTSGAVSRSRPPSDAQRGRLGYLAARPRGAVLPTGTALAALGRHPPPPGRTRSDGYERRGLAMAPAQRRSAGEGWVR
jgi:hypothetical protein